jgi:hypothetical protein
VGFTLVYLFREEVSAFYLVLGQGVTDPRRELGTAGAQVALADKAAQLRHCCGALAEHGFTEHQIRGPGSQGRASIRSLLGAANPYDRLGRAADPDPVR